MKAYINPYNFIPHSGKVGRTPSAEAPGQLVTGEIRCSLTVKTPLAVPDASERLPVVLENGKDRHYVYPFMCAGGVPIIPGSELRGMVRSIYETVTNSCFSIINTNTLSKRDKDPLPEAGLLQWNAALGIWQLFKANRRSYFTPSTLNAAKARLEAQGTDYTERSWNLFDSIKSSWEKMKEHVNAAIEKASDDSSFFAYLEKNDIYCLKAEKTDRTDDQGEDPFILCWKKDYERFGSNKTSFNTKRVNLEKKWGSQYSYENVNSHYGKKLGEEYDEELISVSLFIRQPENPMTVPDEKVSNLIAILDLYKQYNEAGTAQFNAVKPRKDGNYYPVFFDTDYNETDEWVTSLAPAQITRRIYGHTVDMLLGRTEEDPGHSPCTDINKLCPACRLFGMVTQSGGGAVSSRLRFSDAVGANVALYPKYIDKEDPAKNICTLKELSSPKLTSVEFYSLSDGLTGYQDQKPWDYDSDGVTLRGRKVYLHNPKAELNEGDNPAEAVFCTGKKTKRNASMQLATGGSFTFSVYFNGVTEKELKTLVWALTLGDADGSTSLYHKLGHGRPLGLGSVKLRVDKIVRRTTDGTSYRVASETVGKDYFNGFALPIKGTDTLTALQAVYDFRFAEGQEVAYPIGTSGVKKKNDKNTMQWFALSHGKVGRNSQYRYVLHPLTLKGRAVTAQDLLLPHLYKDGTPQETRETQGTGAPSGGGRSRGGSSR